MQEKMGATSVWLLVTKAIVQGLSNMFVGKIIPLSALWILLHFYQYLLLAAVVGVHRNDHITDNTFIATDLSRSPRRRLSKFLATFPPVQFLLYLSPRLGKGSPDLQTYSLRVSTDNVSEGDLAVSTTYMGYYAILTPALLDSIEDNSLCWNSGSKGERKTSRSKRWDVGAGYDRDESHRYLPGQ